MSVTEAVEPVYGQDTCEICHKAMEAGQPALRPFSQVATFDPESGRSRYLWEHQACRQQVQLDRAKAADRAAVMPRHHDPVVADLIARVEALEARKR